MHPWVIYATEVSRDRERQIRNRIVDEERLALASGTLMAEPRSWHVRRSVARGLAVTSRATASVVRQLDECVADDLGRSLAPTE
jgi:hypothetical protein